VSTAREEILARLRAALDGPPAPAPPVLRDYRRRTVGSADLVPLFTERLTDYRAAVHPAAGGTLAATIGSVLRQAGTGRLVVPADLPDDWLADYSGTVLRDAGTLDAGTLDSVDCVLTGCALAIAETGTIVLDSGAAQGRRALTLVPDHHVCVLDAGRIVDNVPEALARLDPTRPLTFISGPSATSDIELRRVEGVHGPRRLDVVIVT
jgi:L-lactate dehydrogenase complex protein LldG